MTVKYLSEEYYKEVNNAIQNDDAVAAAAKGQTIGIQQVISDGPDGELKGWLKITDGAPEVGLGDLDGAEATVTQSYETAVAVAKGELNSQQAFMQGKIKVTGNLMKLMQLQGFLASMGKSVEGIEVEY